MTNRKPIYHLAEPRDWATSTDEYRAPSLETEGFIHCSTWEQLPRTARNLFPGRNDLVLLIVDPEPLGDLVVYEDLYGQDEEFPHVYGPLPSEAVENTRPYLNHLEEGLWLDETRFDSGWLDRILALEFEEVGMSGRRYTREEVMASPPVPLDIELPLDGYTMDLVDEDVALVRYVSRATTEGRLHEAERTSLWINTNEGWRLRFHQGTPTPQT